MSKKITKPNLVLVRLLTEDYIDSADTSTDLVYFTIDAHQKLDKLAKIDGMLDLLSLDNSNLKATHDLINSHLAYAIKNKLKLEM